MAFEAALVHLERLRVTEPLDALEVGHFVVFRNRSIGIERLEGLRLERVRLVLGVAWGEVRVADGVVAALREQRAHALSHARAMESLELVNPVRRGVDDGLRVVHELPDGIHLACECARLLQHGCLGLPLLRLQIEQHEHEERHGEHRGKRDQVDGLQADFLHISPGGLRPWRPPLPARRRL